MKLVYVDNNATTQVDPQVFEAMTPFLTERYGNPSSVHTFGADVHADVENARRQVAECIGAAHSTEIIFTSSGTEANNTAIRSAIASRKGRRTVITSRVEHPAVLSVARRLERDGMKVVYIPVDKQGRLDMVELRASLNEDVALVTIMTANNETGVIFPVEEIGALAHEVGALFHTDAVQAVGKVPLNLTAGHINLLSLSGHKLHAPKGVGALYVHKGTRFRPFILGGHQERGRRAGTENVAGIVALGKACALATQNMQDEGTRVAAMRDRLEEGLLAIPDSVRNGDPEHRLPGTSNVSFKYVEGEAILLMLDQQGICASSGSACTSGTLEPSHVLRAMGVPFHFAHGSIRFSLGRFSTDADVDHILKVVSPIMERLREISPFKD